MPSIMLYGFNRGFHLKRTVGTIETVIQNLNLGGDAVITVVSSRVRYCDGRKTPAPFMRICSTDPKEIKKIIDKLKEVKIGVDIERLVLDGFIPANEMK